MKSIKMYLDSLGRTTRAVLLALAVIFVSAGIAQAATTISTVIQTDGTLSVSGLATFLGGATTTSITLLSGDTLTNAAPGTSVFSGAVTAGAGLTGTTGVFSSTLRATGLATFLGGATTTSLTLLSGDTIKNSAASSTALSGSLTVDANLTLANAQAATSTLSVGCIQATATSSATKIKLIFSTTGATSTFNGTAYWSYGTCP